MTAHSQITGVSASRKLVQSDQPDPGRIDAVQLAQYWRKESTAAAKRMASRFDVRCVVGQYPWLAIWSSEGLAPPPKSYWAMLQQNHLTTDEVAHLLACDARTIRRYVQNPPEGFPPPVFESGKPWLWRTCQIHAYVSGRPVPHFRRATPAKVTHVSWWEQPIKPDALKVGANAFDPYCSR